MIRRRLDLAILIAGASIVAAAFAGTRLMPGWALVLDNVYWTAGAATATALTFLGWRRATGAARTARGWFTAGLAADTFGQIVWDVQIATGWNPFPAPADFGFLLLGPALIAGLLPRGPSVRVAARLDAAALTIAVATLTLALYLPRSGKFDPFTTTVLVAYPALLLGAAGAAIVAILHQRLRPDPCTVGMVVVVTAKGLLWMEWNSRVLDATLVDGGVLNVGFAVVSIGFGVVMSRWQPDVLGGVGVRAGGAHHERMARLLPLMIAVAAAIGVGVGVGAELPAATHTALTIGAVLVLAIAVIRQSISLGDRDRLLAAERVTREHQLRLAAAEVQREQLQAQLTQAQKLEALGTLAGGIAHDFNNILMAIYGHAQLTADEALTASARASINDIISGCERGRDLVRRVLSFSRNREAVATPVQPEKLAAEVVGLLRAALPSTVRLCLEAASGLPRIVADPAQLHQVLMNLATNAWHAIGERAGVIRIAVERARLPGGGGSGDGGGGGGGEYVRFTVSDDGCGMDESTRRRIFEPFFTTRSSAGGTGLGLAVVHGIITAHRGVIDVESTVGEGTRFRIFLPASVAGEVVAAEEQPAAAKSGGGREILVVDDEPLVGHTLARQLHRLGWNATTVDHPLRALELVAAQPKRFAAVIADYTMPSMTGVVLAERLAGICPGTPVVLSTGATEIETVGDSSIAAILHKPYNRNMLASALARAVPGPA